MDVAISGASGLDRDGAVGIARAPTGIVCCASRAAASPAATTIGWDPEAGRIDAPALEGVDAVVHLAGEGIGEHRWTDEQKRSIRESRVRGTAVLAGAIASRERKPRVFVSGSAIGYYGDRGDEVLTEESAPGDDFLAEVCVEWEAETQPAADAGVRTVLDPHRHRARPRTAARSKRMLLPFKLGLGGAAGLGQAVDELDRARRRGRRDPCTRSTTTRCAARSTASRRTRSPTPTSRATLGQVLHRPTLLPTPLLPLEAALTAPSSSSRCCSRASGSRRRSSKRPATSSALRHSRPRPRHCRDARPRA